MEMETTDGIKSLDGVSDGRIGAVPPEPVENKRRSSRTVKVPCAVRACKNDSNTKLNGQLIKMFDYPGNLDTVGIQAWNEAIPELALVSHTQKVCEVHFRSGSSIPSLLLSNEIPRKRKNQADDSSQENVDDDISVVDPKMPKLMTSESDVPVLTSPLSNDELDELPMSKKISDFPESSKKPRSFVQLMGKSVDRKQPMIFPRLTQGSSGLTPSGLPSTSSGPSRTIAIRTADGQLRQVDSSFSRNADGKKLIRLANGKLVRVIPSDSATIAKKVVANANPIHRITYRPKDTYTVNEWNNPAPIDEPHQEEGAATATITSFKPLDLKTILGLASSQPFTDNREEDYKETVSDPSKVDSSEFPPARNLHSLLSDLQQESGSSKEDQPCGGSCEVTEPSCATCISQMPNIRKCLGRLELRLDTMNTMLRSLVARMTASGHEQLPTNSTSSLPVTTPQAVPTTSVNAPISEANAFPYSRPAGTIRFETRGTPISNQRQAVQSIRRPFGNPVITRPAVRLLTGSMPRNNEQYVQRKPLLVSKSLGSKSSMTMPRKIGGVDFLSGMSKVEATPGPSGISDDVHPNPNSLLNSLFSESVTSKPKPEAIDPVAMRKRIARALLLFDGTEFTFGKFRKKYPSDILPVAKSMMEGVLRQLIDDGLLYMEDEDDPLTGKDTVWQKEQAKSNLRPLKKYDIKMETFLATLTVHSTNDADEKEAEAETT